MSDLDARVAALAETIDKYVSNPSTATCAAVLEAIRAELQKPALHEPVTEEEVTAALHITASETGVFTRYEITAMKEALESFLQGRAKPAQEEITDDEFLLQLSRNTLSNVKTAIAKLQELGDKEPIPEQWWAVVSSALYIAAIRASKGEKT